MQTRQMLAHIDGPVGWMTFDNQARRNAVSAEMWAAIPDIIARFEADPAIRIIALTGAGDRAFISGADISQFAEQRSNQEQTAAYDRVSAAATQAIKAATKPTVAVIRGFCIGGGLGVAATCDLRWATAGSKFGVPAGRLGLGYAHPGVKTLMDIVGPAYTKEIFFTAKHFTAAEAQTMGFVNRVLSEAEFDAWVAAELATIARQRPAHPGRSQAHGWRTAPRWRGRPRPRRCGGHRLLRQRRLRRRPHRFHGEADPRVHRALMRQPMSQNAVSSRTAMSNSACSAAIRAAAPDRRAIRSSAPAALRAAPW